MMFRLFSAAALGGILSLAAPVAEAATVTDASLAVDGSYTIDSSGALITGSFDTFLTADRSADRDYVMSFSFVTDGIAPFTFDVDLADSFSGPLSIDDIFTGLATAKPEIVPMVDFLLANDSFSYGGISYGYDVASADATSSTGTFSLGLSRPLLDKYCGFCGTASGDFTLTASLGYDVAPAAVPLPAGLPLLLAGLSGLAVLRRYRRA